MSSQRLTASSPLAVAFHALAVAALEATLLAGLVTVASCDGSGASIKTITTGDVENLPPGNATGTAFSGTYVIRESHLVGCNCRSGTCSNVHASTGGQLAVTQTDGAFRVNETQAVYQGGVDQDGSFRAGYAGAVGSLEMRLLMEGTIVAKTAIDAHTLMTLTGPVDGDQHDCDAEVAIRAPYVGH